MSRRSVSDYIRRYLMLICGLFIMAVGIALSIKANIGISPISCLPYVLNQVDSTFSVGQITAAMHVAFVLFQIVLLRRQFAVYQLLQLVVAVVLGLLIDLGLVMLAFLHPSTYVAQWLVFALSAITVSFGMYLEVKAGVLMVAGEGLVKAIATVTRKGFGEIKISSDCVLVAISLIVGIIYLHKVVGVREGTVLAAILVGWFIKMFDKHFRFVDQFLKINVSTEGGDA
jgi:uncharacterized membrane protein YczE